MNFKEPLKIYTAVTNVEAQLIVSMLEANGIPAHAEEDHSGVSLWHFAILSQFHQPNIWVEKARADEAAAVLFAYEDRRRERDHPGSDAAVTAECEECGQPSQFPAALNGTTQECPHCGSYLDVGELGWEPQDFGQPEE